MGNYRFRLSDMIPNAWFYKLKDMSHRAKKNHSMPHSTATSSKASRAAATATTPPLRSKLAPNRTSCYYSSRSAEADRLAFSPTHSKAMDTHFPLESPRKSKRRSRRKTIRPPVVKPKLVTSPVSAGCSCRAWKADSLMPADFSEVASPETPPCQRDCYIDGGNLPFHKINLDDQQFEYDDLVSWPRYCSCRLTSSETDIIIDMGSNNNSVPRKLEKLGEFDSASELKLPPIITKPASPESETTEFEDKNVVEHKVSLAKEQMNKSQSNNKSSSGLQRLRTRANSPRLASRKVQAYRSRKSMQQRKSLSASFAVVKSSSDPQRDFRDSMLEMIVENNIRASNDLEELLACYLSLNSNEYHDVIVKVFKQIWFDLTNIKSKR